MSKTKRRNHSAEFKARVALEAIRGVKTVATIAAENHLHPVQVTQWKSQMQEAAPEVFARGRGQAVEQARQEAEREQLERKVGQLVVEVDWLTKKCKELGIDP
jgi:transposase-like protein